MHDTKYMCRYLINKGKVTDSKASKASLCYMHERFLKFDRLTDFDILLHSFTRYLVFLQYLILVENP